MDETKEMMDILVTMCIATYLSKEPDAQVVKIAKRAKSNRLSKKSLAMLRTIAKSRLPSVLVRIAYDELSKADSPQLS